MDASEERSLADKKQKQDLFEHQLKNADFSILQFTLRVESLLALTSPFLDWQEILEEKNVFLVPGQKVSCSKYFQIEAKMKYGKDGDEWRLYVNFLQLPSPEHILPSEFLGSVSPNIKLACFFPEGNVAYKINKGRFPEELISFCRMKRVVPFACNPNAPLDLLIQIFKFFYEKLALKMEGHQNFINNLLWRSRDLANLMYDKIIIEEKTKAYLEALYKFGDLTYETSKALEATKSFIKSRKIAAIREKLESQSAAITAEWING